MPLTVRIGPTRDPRTLHRCKTNKDDSPIAVSSKHFVGLVTVRVKDHRPSTPADGESSCAYFGPKTRIFSLQWQGRFMATNPSRPDKIWTGDDILFVAEAESGVKVPPGTFLATKFVRMIDPSFVTDAIFNSHRPWVGSPLISAMNVLRVWTSESEDRGRPSPGSTNAAPRGETEAWINYGENRLEEHGVDLLFSASSKPREETAPVRDRHMKTTTRSTTSWWRSRPDPDKRQVSGDKEKKTLAVAGMTPYQRRRFFTKAEHREAALLRPRLIIAGDFFNNFTDFERAQAKMVITIQFDRVLQGQTLRFVCKSRAKEEQKIGSKVADPGAVALEDTPIHPGDKSNTRRTAEEDAAVFFVVELEWT